jgi:hypothetical protein
MTQAFTSDSFDPLGSKFKPNIRIKLSKKSQIKILKNSPSITELSDLCTTTESSYMKIYFSYHHCCSLWKITSLKINFFNVKYISLKGFYFAVRPLNSYFWNVDNKINICWKITRLNYIDLQYDRLWNHSCKTLTIWNNKWKISQID